MKRSKRTSSSRASKPLRPERARQTVAELRALQRLMAQAVMRPLTAAERMRPRWPDGRPTKTVAAGFIKPNARLTSFDRLEIYNRQYWLRISECFYDDYSGLRAILGEHRFHDLAIAYLINHPSTRFTLRDLGAHLADFIQAEPRWTEPHRELALDMARLEWAHIEAFDNEAKALVTPTALQGLDAARIRLQLQPHITLLKMAYPVDEFLISLRDQSGLRGEASNAMAATKEAGKRARKTKYILPECRTTHLAVHRHQNVVYYKRLQARQFVLLSALKEGASLGKSLQTLPPTGSPPPVRDWFRNWAALGWFWMRD